MARDTLDQLARRLAESLPQGMRAVSKDIEQNFRGILASGLHRLDLVTREEFDVQKAVLERTRGKLEALEGRLAALETPATRPAKAAAAKQAKAAPKTAKKPIAKKTKKKAAKKAATGTAREKAVTKKATRK